MTTPVLTKKQQRHSLSAKKKGLVKFKNVLAQPYPNFWPVINVEQYPKLVTNLNTILPSIPKLSPKLSKEDLQRLKDLPRKARALARKEILQRASEKIPKPDILKFMIMGINAVTRALEKNNVCCVLLDANVDPPLLIKHIVTMAVNKKIPVLLLPILKPAILEKMGFSATAFALTQRIMQDPDNVCHPLYNSIAEAFKDFKPPEYLLQRHKAEPNEMSDKSAVYEATITGTDCDTNSNMSKPEKLVTVFTDVYKRRSSQDKRAFIPPAVNQNSQVSQTPCDEFIALGDFSDLDSVNDKNCTSTSKKERYVNIDKEEKYEARKTENRKINQYFNKLKRGFDNDEDSTKHTENISKRNKKDESKYLSLKIKRIKPNSKRHKATKFTKKQ